MFERNIAVLFRCAHGGLPFRTGFADSGQAIAFSPTHGLRSMRMGGWPTSVGKDRIPRGHSRRQIR
jgi:hypothetical protein